MPTREEIEAIRAGNERRLARKKEKNRKNGKEDREDQDKRGKKKGKEKREKRKREKKEEERTLREQRKEREKVGDGGLKKLYRRTSSLEDPNRASAPWYVHKANTTYHIQIPAAFMITILYWAYLKDQNATSGFEYAKSHAEANVATVATHGGTAVLALADILVNNQPYRLIQLFDALFFGILYIYWTLIFHWFSLEVKCTCNPEIAGDTTWSPPKGCRNLNKLGTGALMDRCDYIYDPANWNHPMEAIWFSILILILIIPVCFVFWWLTTIFATKRAVNQGNLWGGSDAFYLLLTVDDWKIEFGRALVPWIPLGAYTIVRLGFLFCYGAILGLSLAYNEQGLLWLAYLSNWTLIVQGIYFLTAFMSTFFLWRWEVNQPGEVWDLGTHRKARRAHGHGGDRKY